MYILLGCPFFNCRIALVKQRTPRRIFFRCTWDMVSYCFFFKFIFYIFLFLLFFISFVRSMSKADLSLAILSVVLLTVSDPKVTLNFFLVRSHAGHSVGGDLKCPFGVVAYFLFGYFVSCSRELPVAIYIYISVLLTFLFCYNTGWGESPRTSGVAHGKNTVRLVWLVLILRKKTFPFEDDGRVLVFNKKFTK